MVSAYGAGTCRRGLSHPATQVPPLLVAGVLACHILPCLLCRKPRRRWLARCRLQSLLPSVWHCRLRSRKKRRSRHRSRSTLFRIRLRKRRLSLPAPVRVAAAALALPVLAAKAGETRAEPAAAPVEPVRAAAAVRQSPPSRAIWRSPSTLRPRSFEVFRSA